MQGSVEVKYIPYTDILVKYFGVKAYVFSEQRRVWLYYATLDPHTCTQIKHNDQWIYTHRMYIVGIWFGILMQTKFINRYVIIIKYAYHSN